MDRIDLHILDILQNDAATTLGAVAARVGLSQTPCWKRIQKLEASGVIEKRVALLAPQKLGLNLVVHVAIRLGDTSPEAASHFVKRVEVLPEVIAIDRIAGAIDYVLRVVVKDAGGYDVFLAPLRELLPQALIESHFVLHQIKRTSVLPLGSDVSHKDDVLIEDLSEASNRQLSSVLSLRSAK